MVLSYQQAQISMFNVKIDPQLKKILNFQKYEPQFSRYKILILKRNVIHSDCPLGDYAIIEPLLKACFLYFRGRAWTVVCTYPRPTPAGIYYCPWPTT